MAQHMSYPKQYETVFITENKIRINVRPLKTTDEQLLQDLYLSLDDRDLFLRFCQVGKISCLEAAHEEVNIDYQRQFCIGALVGEASNQEIIGTAGFFLNQITNNAEYSFVIKKAWRNHGIGQFLLQHLVLIAKKKGIKGFYGTIHMENKNTIHIFKKYGEIRITPPELGEKELFFELLFD